MKSYNIKVNLTEEDISQLMYKDSKFFLWEFPTIEDEEVTVKIHLFKGEDDV
tara:strand:+ start:83 stop:238 length:156 start_codon:yes stop_codon:yes gene_type:complete